MRRIREHLGWLLFGTILLTGIVFAQFQPPPSGGGGGGGVHSSLGLFAARAAGTTAGDLFSATDSSINSVWTGSAWQDFTSGIPITLPTVSTFGTAVNVTSSTLTAATGPLIFSDLDSMVVMYARAIPTNTAVFLFTASPASLTSFQEGVVFRESATGKLLLLSIAYVSGTVIDVSRWNSPTSFNASVFRQATATLGGALLGFRLRQAGSSLFCDISFDRGYHWAQVYTETKTAFFTTAPDQVGPAAVQSGEVMTVYSYSTT